MKVLHVVPYLGQVFGGTTTVVRSIAAELAGAGHEVMVVTTDYRLEDGEGGHRDGYEVVPFPSRANLGLFIYSPELGRWLSRHASRYDVMHLHTFRSYQNVLARRAAVHAGIPYVLQAHGGMLPSFGRRGQKELFDLAYGRGILRDASRAIAVSGMEVGQYEAMGVPRERVSLVPNGVRARDFEPPSSAAFRERFGLGDRKVVLFLGRIDRLKGLDLLVDAFARVARARDDCVLVIVGPDFGHLAAVREDVRARGLSDRVVLTGPLQGESKAEAYAEAEVCVVPSSFDIFSMTALEAMAYGTPVIVTDRCGIAEHLDGVGGVVDLDPGRLAEAIREVLSSEELRARWGRAGQELVRRELDWSIVIRRLEAVYRSVTGDASMGEAE